MVSQTSMISNRSVGGRVPLPSNIKALSQPLTRVVLALILIGLHFETAPLNLI
jgi:hypothetical protein